MPKHQTLDTVFIEIVSAGNKNNAIRANHYHEFYELYFYMGDSMTYYIDNTAYEVERYDLIFITKSVPHRANYKDDKKERALIMFREEILDVLADKAEILGLLEKLGRMPVLRFSEHVIGKLKAQITDLAEKYSENAEDTFGLQIAIINFLLSIRQYIDGGELVSMVAPAADKQHIVRAVMEYIAENYSENITLDALSNRFFIDKYYLCHSFKKATGMTVVSFLNERRLIEAKKLLFSSDYNISEIYLQVGFQSQNHFNALFKNMFGKTPSAARKERNL